LIINENNSPQEGDTKMVRLDRLYEELKSIRHRLDDIERMFSAQRSQPLNISESVLLSLPDNLRKTYLIVASEGECSATGVSDLSGRCRASESNYLNQLVRMGWLTKRRASKTSQFQAVQTSKEGHRLIHTNVLLQTHNKMFKREGRT
jgi:hypothetical protein